MKRWNMLVYKWLFTYIYKDIYESLGQNKKVAKVTVILLSAIFHEIILASSMKMCFPCLFVSFFTMGAMSTVFSIPNKNLSHILSKFLFCWGTGFLLTAYSIEYNLTLVDNNITDCITPRSILLVLSYLNK